MREVNPASEIAELVMSQKRKWESAYECAGRLLTLAALERHGWQQRAAADWLGVSWRVMNYKAHGASKRCPSIINPDLVPDHVPWKERMLP